jgi:hypothetical protein
MREEVVVDITDYLSSREDIDKVFEIVKRTNRKDPDSKDVVELRKLLNTIPDLWRVAGDFADRARAQLIQRISGTPLIEESLKAGTTQICRNLGYDSAPEIERLLIEQVVLCWVRLNLLESRYTSFREQHTLTIAQAHFLERRLNYAQRRYLRACETLARVRKIVRRTPALQINIATAGGQQVNVAGDVQTGTGGGQPDDG